MGAGVPSRGSITIGAGYSSILQGSKIYFDPNAPKPDRVFGMDNDDILNGSGEQDFIYGYDGDDEIHGGNGSDVIEGGNGNDVIYGKADMIICTVTMEMMFFIPVTGKM